MSKRQYPYISARNKLPRIPRCVICGAAACSRITVQVSYFRGDDEVFDACEKHMRSTAEELIEAAAIAQQRGSGEGGQ